MCVATAAPSVIDGPWRFTGRRSGASLIAIGRPDRRPDHDLDVGAQPAGLGRQLLDLPAATGAGGEQHDTSAHDHETPAHSRPERQSDASARSIIHKPSRATQRPTKAGSAAMTGSHANSTTSHHGSRCNR
jgi:hypothetical protein